MASEEGTRQGLRIAENYLGTGPIDHQEHLRRSTMRLGEDLYPDYKPKRNHTNNYGQDRELMKKRDRATAFSGIDGGIQSQDLAMIETMGRISIHEKEHLGASDLGIINFRKRLVDAVTSFVAGGEPPALDPPVDYAKVRAVGELVPKGDDWRPVAWTAGQAVTSGT